MQNRPDINGKVLELAVAFKDIVSEATTEAVKPLQRSIENLETRMDNMEVNIQ